MIDKIKHYLGDQRTEQLRSRWGGQVFADELEIAILSAARREMTPGQRVIFAAIVLLRKAGIRPTKEDERAWQAAGKPPAKVRRTGKGAK